MAKKATKRRQLLEKHTPGWNPEDASEQEKGQTSRKQESAEKAREKPAKKTSRTQEAVEKGLAGQKPIKIKLRRQDQEPEDFIRKIRQETTHEEAEEEPTETLVRRSKKRDQE